MATQEEGPALVGERGQGSGRGPRRPRAGHILAVCGVQLLWALLALPQLFLLVLLIPLFHMVIPLTAEGGRASARLLGVDAPSARQGLGFAHWLPPRVTQGAFWRQDLPLVLTQAVLGLLSAAVAFVGLVLAATLLVSPFLVSPQRPVWLVDNEHSYTSFLQVWWLIPCGLGVGALVGLLLWALGTVNLRVTGALSTADEEERLRHLSGQVEDLRQGRSTLAGAYEVERRRIERDLHDGTQQRLVALNLLLGRARVLAELQARGVGGVGSGGAGADRNHTDAEGEAPGGGDGRGPTDPPTHLPASKSAPEVAAPPVASTSAGQLVDLIDQAQDQTEASLRELREVVRGIRPGVLADMGLVAAVEDLVVRCGLQVDLYVSGEASPAPSVADAVYFAVSEALTNVLRHSGQRRAEVVLDLDGSADHTGGADGAEDAPGPSDRAAVHAEVRDHGCGGAVPGAAGSTGLAGLAQRLEVVGGSLRVDSPTGAGTRVVIDVPGPSHRGPGVATQALRP